MLRSLNGHIVGASFNQPKGIKMQTYTLHSDPGHGWLEVPIAELQELGIIGQITSFSYVSSDGETAYLEEDCDLSTFARAKGWNPDGSAPILDKYHKGECFVRALPCLNQR